ncbi:MAG: glycosyltransferase family 8 protein [Rikenellaceae bacterium]
MNNNIAISYSTDDRYAQHLSASLASLLVNANGDEQIDIFILNNGSLSNFHKRRIKVLERLRKHSTIDFLTIDDTAFEELPLTGLPIETYYRFAVPQLLKEYSRAIYLDCDTIIEGDIANLASVDFGGKYIAAVPDILGKEFKEHINVKDREFVYCNAGVLLFNLEAIRRDSVDKLLFENADKYSDLIRLGDQDIINITMAQLDGFKHLGYEWNLGHTTKFVSKEMLKPAMANPQIIHFMGRVKPWDYGCKQTLRAKYWRYLKYTEYRGYAIEYRLINPLLGRLKQLKRFIFRTNKNYVKQKRTVYFLFIPIYRRYWRDEYVRHYICGIPIYWRRKK